MAKKNKPNYLLEKIVSIFSNEKRGKVLDLGCGDGDYSVRLKALGFDVLAADMDVERFKQRGKIDFRVTDVTKPLPFEDGSFDYVLLAEVIEHLRNPYAVLTEIHRVLKSNGKIILSTPNILNIKSRLRYLIEGCYEFFREPPLDQINNPKEVIFNLHIVPYRYHELEYLLFANKFKVEHIFTSVCENIALSFFVPLIKMQLFLKERRAMKKGGIDYSRTHNIMLSKELLFGRHLILLCKKM